MPGGGYYYLHDDVERLVDEARKVRDLGYTHFKLKIGSAALEQDLKRIAVVSKVMSSSRNVAVDAMNSYGREAALEAAAALAPLELWWLEDICEAQPAEIELSLVDPVQQFDPGNCDRAVSNRLNPSIGPMRDFTPRWSCSIRLLRYCDERSFVSARSCPPVCISCTARCEAV